MWLILLKKKKEFINSIKIYNIAFMYIAYVCATYMYISDLYIFYIYDVYIFLEKLDSNNVYDFYSRH